MIRWPNPGRRVLAIMAAGALCITLTGCPPRKPTPVAAPAGNWIGDSTLVAIRDSSLVGRISYLVILGAHRDTAASQDTARSYVAGVHRRGNCRLTDSPARTSVVLFIHRTVRLIRDAAPRRRPQT